MSMRKLITGAVAAMTVVSGLVLAPPASAAQGGDDKAGDPHVWIKMGRGEFQGNTVIGPDKACTYIFGYGYSGFRPCDNLVPALVNQRMANKNANGYWAEWYYKSKRTRSGTW